MILSPLSFAQKHKIVAPGGCKIEDGMHLSGIWVSLLGYQDDRSIGSVLFSGLEVTVTLEPKRAVGQKVRLLYKNVENMSN